MTTTKERPESGGAIIMNNMHGEELLKELCKVIDVELEFVQHYTIHNSDHEAVVNIKDIMNDDEKIRLAIFQVTYRGYSIVPF